MARALTFIDACNLLGETPPLITRINKLLALGATTAANPHIHALSAVKLLKGAQNIVDHAPALLKTVNERLGRTAPHGRHELMVAAHTIVVTAAFFEAFQSCEPAAKDFELLREDQLALAAETKEREPFHGPDLVTLLLDTPIPIPSAHLSLAPHADVIRDRYRSMARDLSRFIGGLAAWDGLDDTKRSRLRRVVEFELAGQAVTVYERRLPELAARQPDFFAWTTINELKATGRALADLETHLERCIQSGGEPGATARALALAYHSALVRPMLPVDDAQLLGGLSAPALADGYIEPAFRVARATAQAQPGDDQWWSENTQTREDLLEFLVRFLTVPEAAESPLVVIGHPGSGKSQLGRVIAARLPADRFVPVRVELGQPRTPALIHEQIERAISRITKKPCAWGAFSEEAAAERVMPVVFLDGLDELRHEPGENQARYLKQVQQFQDEERTQHRPVAVIVTTRTVVASQLIFPPDCLVMKLEPFDVPRVHTWVTRWNEANRTSPARELDATAALHYRQLAEQPLLLYMLALYGSAQGGLSSDGEPISVVQLYESVLKLFVEREVEREWPDRSAHERSQRITRELDSLGIFAFSIFNRDARSVTAAEMAGDMQAIASDAPRSPNDWTAERAIERFFFVYKSWSETNGSRTAGDTYEFVHATLGEYLVARKCLRLLEGDDVTGPHEAEAQLFALLSFTPLTNIAQIVEFLCDKAQELPDDARERMTGRAHHLFSMAHQARTGPQHDEYQPRQCSIVDRHLLFSLNMLILLLAVRKEWHLPLADLTMPSDVARNHDVATRLWSRIAQLWRSQLLGDAWDAVVGAVETASVVERNRGTSTLAPAVFLGYREPKSVRRPDPPRPDGGQPVLQIEWERDRAGHARSDMQLVLDPYLHAVTQAALALDIDDSAFDYVEKPAPPFGEEDGANRLYPALHRSSAGVLARLECRHPEMIPIGDLWSALELLNHVELGPSSRPIVEVVVKAAMLKSSELDQRLIGEISRQVIRVTTAGWLTPPVARDFAALSLGLRAEYPEMMAVVLLIIRKSRDRIVKLQLMALAMDWGAELLLRHHTEHPIDDLELREEVEAEPRLLADAFRLADVIGDEQWHSAIGLPLLRRATDRQLMCFSIGVIGELVMRMSVLYSPDDARSFARRVIELHERVWESRRLHSLIRERAPLLADFGRISTSSDD